VLPVKCKLEKQEVLQLKDRFRLQVDLPVDSLLGTGKAAAAQASL